MNRSGRLAAGAIAGAHMAGGALIGNGNIAVELPWIPGCEPAFVAAVAIGD